jgi:hypothetical protein
MANAATVTTTMAGAAKNCFAGAMAQGGAGPGMLRVAFDRANPIKK